MTNAYLLNNLCGYEKDIDICCICLHYFFNNVIAATGWLFKTEEEAKKAFPDGEIKSITIADPSYDQTFKKILSTSEESKDHLMSFLNSIYYPDATKKTLK